MLEVSRFLRFQVVNISWQNHISLRLWILMDVEFLSCWNYHSGTIWKFIYFVLCAFDAMDSMWRAPGYSKLIWENYGQFVSHDIMIHAHKLILSKILWAEKYETTLLQYRLFIRLFISFICFSILRCTYYFYVWYTFGRGSRLHDVPVREMK